MAGNGNGDNVKWMVMMAVLGLGGAGTNAAQFFGSTRPAVEAEAEAVRTTQAAAVVVGETMSDSERWRDELHQCQEELHACWRSCGELGGG
jgi:hypothetical protein